MTGRDHVTQRHWLSFHQDYLQFAVDSVVAATEAQSKPIQRVSAPLYRPLAPRAEIEAVRYSYDALDASVEFLFDKVRSQETSLSPDDTWLKRFVLRKFHELNLGDKLGLLAWAYAGIEFWQTADQRALFDDLKKLRDGLCHPRIVKIEESVDVLERLQGNGIKVTVGKLCDQKASGAEVFVNPKRTACFATNPFHLSASDAEKALEIALLHIVRLEDLFFKSATKFFEIYDRQIDAVTSPRALLRTRRRYFDHIWPLPKD